MWLIQFHNPLQILRLDESWSWTFGMCRLHTHAKIDIPAGLEALLWTRCGSTSVLVGSHIVLCISNYIFNHMKHDKNINIYFRHIQQKRCKILELLCGLWMLCTFIKKRACCTELITNYKCRPNPYLQKLGNEQTDRQEGRITNGKNFSIILDIG